MPTLAELTKRVSLRIPDGKLVPVVVSNKIPGMVLKLDHAGNWRTFYKDIEDITMGGNFEDNILFSFVMCAHNDELPDLGPCSTMSDHAGHILDYVHQNRGALLEELSAILAPFAEAELTFS